MSVERRRHPREEDAATIENTRPTSRFRRDDTCGNGSCNCGSKPCFFCAEKRCKRAESENADMRGVPLDVQCRAKISLPVKQRNADGKDVLPLERALMAFLGFITPTVSMRKGARKVLDDVNFSLSSLGLRVEVFGSWCTGICIPKSDIDFVAVPCSGKPPKTGLGVGINASDSNSFAFQQLTSGDDFSWMSKRERHRLLGGALRVVANKLRSFGVFHSVMQISRAKVPIIKATHGYRWKVDITFKKDGLLTTQFLCDEFKKHQFRLARGLIILLKALVENWNLDDPSVGGLGSFPIAVMVLWFLHDQAAEKYPPEFCDCYAVCFVGLLKYYGTEFNSKTTGIDYANKRTFTKDPSTGLCIMNPLLPQMNCAVAASKFSSCVVPMLSGMYRAFSGLLDSAADLRKLEEVLCGSFGSSIAAMGDVSQLQKLLWQEGKLASAGSLQHLWEAQTRFYVGSAIGI